MAEFFEASEEPEPAPSVQTDTAAVAIALDRARRRKKGGGAEEEVDRFLSKQEGLIDDQRAHLREQMAHMRLKHFDQRLSVMLKLMTAALGAAVLVALAAMAWSASRDYSLVIESLGAPPDMTQQGVTGAALASRLHDKLAEMQAQTSNIYAAVAVRDSSESRVKVEIPETGVSLGEIDQLFHQWLGHQARVSGEVSHLTTGPEQGVPALTIRVGEEPGVRLIQADGDLEALLGRGAEYIYRARQPLRFVGWLSQHGRRDDAIALCRELSQRGSNADRAEALSQLASLLGNAVPVEERLAMQRQSFALNPKGSAAANLAGAEAGAGLYEAALNQARLQIKTPPPPGGSAEANRFWPMLGAYNASTFTGDFQPTLSLGCALYGVDPCGLHELVDTALTTPNGVMWDLRPQGRLPGIAQWTANHHAVSEAARWISVPHAPPQDLADAGAVATAAAWLTAAIEVDRQREDWAAIPAKAETFEMTISKFPGTPPGTVARLTYDLALAKLGRGPEALARIGATKVDCYPCLVMRGQIAATLGDRAGAERWFAEAARQGPSLPQADLEWARLLLATGQPDAAIAHLTKADAAGPRYSDPLEVWGEALLAKGDAAGAIKKFTAADKLTPWWGRLHLKWGGALAKQGKADEARAQLKTAAALDLTLAERTELSTLKQ